MFYMERTLLGGGGALKYNAGHCQRGGYFKKNIKT